MRGTVESYVQSKASLVMNPLFKARDLATPCKNGPIEHVARTSLLRPRGGFVPVVQCSSQWPIASRRTAASIIRCANSKVVVANSVGKCMADLAEDEWQGAMVTRDVRKTSIGASAPPINWMVISRQSCNL